MILLIIIFKKVIYSLLKVMLPRPKKQKWGY